MTLLLIILWISAATLLIIILKSLFDAIRNRQPRKEIEAYCERVERELETRNLEDLK